jgi:16S rRNA (uracil1498-N3)-methyltransferase
MRSTRLFVDCPIKTAQLLDLNEQASHHLARVLRCKAGEQLVLFNGQGGEYPAEIIAVGKKLVRVQVSDFHPVNRESTLHIQLGLAISRGERMDWAIQKATELGVTTITPLLAQRVQGQRKPQQLQKKHDHWQAVVIAACEQSGRTAIPALSPALELAAWLSDRQADCKLVMEPSMAATTLPLEQISSVMLMVGCEGGWTSEELSLASQHNFQGLKLGPRILRTETAPLAAISLCQSRWGDMRQSDF